MKIKKINNTDYQIYIFNNWGNKEEIEELIYSLKNKLSLKGYYQIIINYKKIGTFIEINRIEDSCYKRVLDLKIIEEDDDVYFKTSDYFLIKDMNNIKYLDNDYYVLVDDYFDKLFEKVEFGEFIFGDKLYSVVGDLNET